MGQAAVGQDRVVSDPVHERWCVCWCWLLLGGLRNCEQVGGCRGAAGVWLRGRNGSLRLMVSCARVLAGAVRCARLGLGGRAAVQECGGGHAVSGEHLLGRVWRSVWWVGRAGVGRAVEFVFVACLTRVVLSWWKVLSLGMRMVMMMILPYVGAVGRSGRHPVGDPLRATPLPPTRRRRASGVGDILRPFSPPGTRLSARRRRHPRWLARARSLAPRTPRWERARLACELHRRRQRRPPLGPAICRCSARQSSIPRSGRHLPRPMLGRLRGPLRVLPYWRRLHRRPSCRKSSAGPHPTRQLGLRGGGASGTRPSRWRLAFAAYGRCKRPARTFTGPRPGLDGGPGIARRGRRRWWTRLRRPALRTPRAMRRPSFWRSWTRTRRLHP